MYTKISYSFAAAGNNLTLTVAILAQAISCSNVPYDFSASRAFLVLSCPSVYNPVVASHLSFFMSRASNGTDVLVSPVPASSSSMGSPHGSLPDLDGVGGLTRTIKIFLQFDVQFAALASIPMLVQGFTRIEKTILSLTQSVNSITNNISNIEQAVDGLAARVAALEAGAASASSGSYSAKSWNLLGQSDASRATGSLGSQGPGSSDDSRNTRRRIDTFSSSEDEHARSAVLLRFPCEQYHTGITNWINNLWENPTCQPIIEPSAFIAKQVPCRSYSCSKQEPSVRTLWPDIKMIVSPLK